MAPAGWNRRPAPGIGRMFSAFDSQASRSAALLASGMKFGIATFVTDEGIGPARLGEELEARGFDSVFLAEHSHIPVSRATPYPGRGELPRKYYRTLDPFVALTAMASAPQTCCWAPVSHCSPNAT